VRLDVRANGLALAASLLLAASVKTAYPRLGPDELRWMTWPTQALVGLGTGIDFDYEGGYGYVSLAHHLVIAKSCTGVNYLLAVFGLMAFTLVPSLESPYGKLPLVGALAACAYAVTIVVNAVRITLGVALHEGGVAWGWLDAARVHRIAGIAVYFVSLVGVHALGRLAIRRVEDRDHAASPLLAAPLFWYGALAIAAPLLNGAFAARPLLFAEHCAWVAGVTLMLAGALSRRCAGGGHARLSAAAERSALRQSS
jgi:exosortase K